MKKGTIGQDYVPTNACIFHVDGIPRAITCTTTGDLEQEIVSPDMPDNTSRSAGVTRPIEFDINVPMHHIYEIELLDLWHEQCLDLVSPLAYRTCVMTYTSHFGQMVLTVPLENTHISKRKLPGTDASNDGEMAVVTYTLKCDTVGKIIPIPNAG